MRSKTSRALGIAPSTSYYQYLMPTKDALLLSRIKAVMKDNPAYGHERVATELKESKERIRRVMKANSLKPAIRRIKPWTKPESVALVTDLQNLIRDWRAARPSHIWASDFTYLWFQSKWYYLATVLDLFSREIVGWQLGRRSHAQLIHLAYCDGLSQHPPPLIFHADQGGQYTATSTKQLVELTGGQVSYSDKASPWQNGFQESFYGHFKLELGDLHRFKHEGELFEAIAKQLYYYNHKRIHTALKTKPVEFRENYLAKTARE
jgi:transposase InsO family protein